jgi:hypothetical protein
MDGGHFGSADEFLRRWLRFAYRRTVSRPGRGELRWRAQWWSSEEALGRVEAMWRSWEQARLDPVGMTNWWLYVADPMMRVLLSDDGPFAGATDENRPGEPLPYEQPPAGMFAADRQG